MFGYYWIVGLWGCVDQCVALLVITLSIVFGVQDLKYLNFANDVLLLFYAHEISIVSTLSMGTLSRVFSGGFFS